MIPSRRHLLLVICCLFLSFEGLQAEDRAVSFNRDIRPILTDHCFACHGPDAKSVAADLRLDLRDEATKTVIVPGEASSSELMRRVLSSDVDEVMPPEKLHKPLNKKQIDLLRRWITEGAKYEQHWAYTQLVRPEVPKVNGIKSGGHPVDQFIATRFQEENAHFSPPADPVTLIRRLSFDLTGLPPTPEEVASFLKDTSPQAYEKLVDRLLASPRYGERMAIYWLDLVRYADTVGYHGDQDVSISPYRDYVIRSFNQNTAYDQFVREQLAGDLLPNPTREQLIATGYNRLHQTTEEGGAQPKEYLAIYFADRVRNVSQVFMGATVGCAQCHDHKYDPYTTKDFYALGAFFADMEEVGKYGARSRPPEMKVTTPEQDAQLAKLDTQIAAAKTEMQRVRKQLQSEQSTWEREALQSLDEHQIVEKIWIDDAQDTGGSSSGAWNFVSSAKGPVTSGKASRRQTARGLTQHFFLNAKKPVTVEAETNFYAWIYLDPNNPPEAIMLQFNEGKANGDWSHRAVWGNDKIEYGRKPDSWNGYQRMGPLPELGQWIKLEVSAEKVGLQPGKSVNGMAFTQFAGTAYWDKTGWVQAHSLPAEIIAALKTDSETRDQKQKKLLTDHFLSEAPAVLEQQAKIDAFKKEKQAIADRSITTLITKSTKPRTIRILPRGNWMDDSGEIVEPAIPEFLGTLESDSRLTRLDLANWMCEDNNVLTARTMVNRLWLLMFGRGICSSVDDFGGQGTFPSHPELLDYLAVEFVESGWDIKHLLKLIATSRTYQQSSTPSPELQEADPYNQLFARQDRFRISAEMVRDSTLLTSGLLVEKIGGPSSKPYQPAGYYAQLNFPRRTYVADSGDNQYRRGLYTHWQRTFLHPMLKAFDAPTREECTAQRSRSNTPVQALTLLNDPTFVEAARVFAERIMREGGESVDSRIVWAYRTAVSRDPEPFVTEQLRLIYQNHLKNFAARPEEAQKFISVGAAPVADDLKKSELAAWTSVARVILNLRETITRY